MGKKWRAFYTLQGKGSDSAGPVDGIADVDSSKSAEPTCWNPDIRSDASWVALQGIVEMIKGNVNSVRFSFKIFTAPTH